MSCNFERTKHDVLSGMMREPLQEGMLFGIDWTNGVIKAKEGEERPRCEIGITHMYDNNYDEQKYQILTYDDESFARYSYKPQEVGVLPEFEPLAPL
jgi:hypothetical protein